MQLSAVPCNAVFKENSMSKFISVAASAIKKTGQALARVFVPQSGPRQTAYERYLNGAMDMYDLEARERQWSRRHQQHGMF